MRAEGRLANANEVLSGSLCRSVPGGSAHRATARPEPLPGRPSVLRCAAVLGVSQYRLDGAARVHRAKRNTKGYLMALGLNQGHGTDYGLTVKVKNVKKCEMVVNKL